MGDRTCAVDGCNRVHYGRGWCQPHWKRWKKFGDPLGCAPAFRSAEIRFWEKVDASGDCWEWTGLRNFHGYGRFGTDGTEVQAHRFAWEVLVGLIPDGLHIDHLCRNRACVNPDHLEPVTPGENSRRGVGGVVARNRKTAETACKRGHPYTEENTAAASRGYRRCLACAREDGNKPEARERNNAWRRARRAATKAS